MSELNLEEIEARANSASEGPWKTVTARYGYDMKDSWAVEPDGPSVHNVAHITLGELDAKFIAHAREDVPALIAEVRRLRTQIERVQKMSDDMSEGKARCLLVDGKEGDYPISYFIEMLNEALGGDNE